MKSANERLAFWLVWTVTVPLLAGADPKSGSFWILTEGVVELDVLLVAVNAFCCFVFFPLP